MEKKDYIIRFSKPYSFEGKEYSEVDLSNIESLTTSDLSDAEKIFTQSGNIAAVNEMSIGYACIIASKASGKPVEFYQGLPAKEGIKVKNAVTRFFYN